MGILAMVYIFFENKSFLIVPIPLYQEIKINQSAMDPTLYRRYMMDISHSAHTHDKVQF